MTATELRPLLEELVAALDRRLPGAGRLGEAAIAREAADLRAKAVALLTELDAPPVAVSVRVRDDEV